MDPTVITKYFPDLTEKQKDKFRQLGPLYKNINERVNLISRKDIDELYTRHVLHSLAIAMYFTPVSGTKIMDIGTGGGFPGIPLAILWPDVEFILVDSILKKTKAVQEVVDALKLDNVRVVHGRAEQVKEQVDFVTCRAVARINKLLQWTKGYISKEHKNSIKNGYLFLKGGELHDEISESGKHCRIQLLKEYFNDPFFETKKLLYIPT